MAMSGGSEDGEPMGEMNTTPLIDVMLVLLIMFIITIPIQTHAVKVDLPQDSDSPRNQDVDPVKNKIVIYPDGQLSWNGAPVNEVTLTQYLDQTVQMSPQPELHFQPDAQARYDRVDEIMAIIKRANVTKLGFIGNEQYREF
jgi:biopolymer transport protein ExbD